MPNFFERRLPPSLWNQMVWIKTRLDWSEQWIGNLLGFSIARKNDYYSPLPSIENLRKNRKRWDKPASLTGISYNLAEMKHLLSDILSPFWAEFEQISPYRELQKFGFGPGYNEIDARILYSLVRTLKPHRYIEIGSGVSTYYCKRAADKNISEDQPLQITCVEPYPSIALKSLSGIHLIVNEVQSLSTDIFEKLEANDILFIDSSHILKIDGDVPFIYLEILPRLKPGVWIHIHDIPFPYNTPYPANYWIFDRGWPKFWSETMLVQAFLMFNNSFQLQLSLPLLRYHDETFLRQIIPNYKTVQSVPNTFSSLWIKRM